MIEFFRPPKGGLEGRKVVVVQYWCAHAKHVSPWLLRINPNAGAPASSTNG